MKWFRMYSDAVDDDKLRLLAFEDRWHFVALCCLKCEGLLDSGTAHLERRIAIKLGLQMVDLDEVKRRLIDVELIDTNFQPLGWGKRQYEHDSSKERTRKYRERLKKKERDDAVTSQECHGDVSVTGSDTDTDTDTESNGKKRKRFVPPSLDQIHARISEMNYRHVDAEVFFHHYEANGWKVGKNKMASWTRALGGWESRAKAESKSNTDDRYL